MSRCLCCGKEIADRAGEQEKAAGWHEKCIKKFFGTKTLPDIDITEDLLHTIAIESTGKGYTVPGVQKKLSLHLTNGKKNERPRLTLVNYPTGYILKPQTEEYPALPEAEYLVMSMAKVVGIKTVPFALIRQGQSFAYITKRIDRSVSGRNHDLKMLAMEDFCQLDGRLTQDKYRGSYERCGKIVSRYSIRAGLDMTELFMRIVFSYIVGNSDMHLKNFSLIETKPGERNFVLSAAYDMLPVNIVLPEDKEQFALSLNGKKRNVTRNDLLTFAASCNIDKKVAAKLIDTILRKKDALIALCRESYLPEDMKINLENLIEERVRTITKK